MEGEVEQGEDGAEYEEGHRRANEDDSDEEDEVFCDPDTDPDVLRKVYVLEGQMDEDEDEDGDAGVGDGQDDDENEAGSGLGLRPDGFGDDREGDEMVDDSPMEDMSSGKLQGHAQAIYAVAVNPTNPDIIATASGDDTAGIWSRSDLTRRATLVGHTDTVVDVAFSASGLYLATAGMDSVVKVWKVEDGTLVINLEGPSEDILWVQWHQKGDVVVAGSTDMSVWMWNVPSGNCMAVFSGHSGAVNCGKFTQDGKHVITASQDCSARVWNPKDGQCLVTMHDPKGAGTFHMASITCLDTRDDLLLTGAEDSTAMLTRLVFGGPDTLPTAKVVSILKHHEDALESVAFCANEPFFATGGLDGRAFIYDLASHNTPRVTCQHDAGVTQVKWHPQMSWLISAGVDRTVRAWDAKSGATLAVWTGHTDTVMGLALSPDGRYLVSASDDGTARIWDFPTS